MQAKPAITDAAIVFIQRALASDSPSDYHMILPACCDIVQLTCGRHDSFHEANQAWANEVAAVLRYDVEDEEICRAALPALHCIMSSGQSGRSAVYGVDGLVPLVQQALLLFQYPDNDEGTSPLKEEARTECEKMQRWGWELLQQ